MQPLSENFVCSVAMEGFFEKYDKIVAKFRFITEWPVFRAGQQKQKRIWGDKFQVSFEWEIENVHRFTFMIFSGTLDIGTMDISRLCHNTLCIQSCHLPWSHIRSTVTGSAVLI